MLRVWLKLLLFVHSKVLQAHDEVGDISIHLSISPIFTVSILDQYAIHEYNEFDTITTPILMFM